MKYVNIINYSKVHDNRIIAITARVFNTYHSLRKSVLRTGTNMQCSRHTYRAVVREQNKQKKNFRIFTRVLVETNKIKPDALRNEQRCLLQENSHISFISIKPQRSSQLNSKTKCSRLAEHLCSWTVVYFQIAFEGSGELSVYAAPFFDKVRVPLLPILRFMHEPN